MKTLLQGVLLLILVPAAASAQSDLECPKAPPPDCTTMCCSDECSRGDPIQVVGRNYFHRMHQARLQASPAPLDVYLTFTSNVYTWSYFNTQFRPDLLDGVPKPFGGTQGFDYNKWNSSLYWSHNWFAFVTGGGSLDPNAACAAEFADAFLVRDTRGTQHEFGARSSWLYRTSGVPANNCEPVLNPPPNKTQCWLTGSVFAPSTPSRLLRTVDYNENPPLESFTLYQSDGSSEVYSAKYSTPAQLGPQRLFYFLTKVYDSAGRLVADVAYANPFPANPDPCPEGAAGSNGVPYISTITAGSGQQLVFSYQKLQGNYGPGNPLGQYRAECVPTQIAGRASAAAPLGSWVAQYTYRNGGTQPGWLIAANGTENSEEFTHVVGQPPNGYDALTRKRGGAQVAYFTTGGVGAGQPKSTGFGQNIYLPPYGSEVPVNDIKNVPYTSYYVERSVEYADAGNGANGFATSYKETLRTIKGQWSLQHKPFLYSETVTCNPTSACSAGDPNSVPIKKAIVGGKAIPPCGGNSPYDSYLFPETAHTNGEGDRLGNWTITPMRWAFPDAGLAQVIPAREQTASHVGALPPSGGSLLPDPASALESESYGYQYGADGRQHVSSVKRTSVVDGTQIETVYKYQGDRLTAVFETGKTKTFGSETVVTKTRAYFFKTARACKETGQVDELNRPVRVEGPCSISPPGDTSATGCSGTGDPVMELVYYPQSDPTPEKRGRLKSVWEFPNGSLNCASSGFSTVYNGYTIAGDPTSVTNRNGVTETLTYSNNGGGEQRELVSRSLPMVYGQGTKTWSYSWDNHKIREITYPELNKQIFCYRIGATTPACTDGTWSELLQWQAKCNQALTSCPEKIEYAYWDDQSVKTAKYISSSDPANPRRIEAYSRDAQGRLTWERSGSNVGSAGFTVKRRYDAADRLTAIGLAANAAPDFCLTTPGGSPSNLCTWMKSDRADRLAEVDFHPSAVATSRSCFEYDAAGNIKRVSNGGDGTTACNINNTGSAVVNDAYVDYEWDDFGNIIRVKAPWTENGASRAVTTYEYNVFDRLVAKQSEEMRAASASRRLTYSYDSLARLLEARRYTSAVDDVLLYRLGYDMDEAIESGCQALVNANGRLSLRDDSFGRTWYLYDEEGHVLKEMRRRDGYSGCETGWNPTADKSPSTDYQYDKNGNLVWMRYPHTYYYREISYTYNYPTGGDRPISVQVAYWYQWWAWTTVVDNAVWEPYGELRAYRLTPSDKWVEYSRFGDPQADATGGNCVALTGGASATDGSGRTRGVFVTNGNGTGTRPFPDGQIFKQIYKWGGDRVSKTWTCHRSWSGPVNAEDFAYDDMQRLTSMTSSGTGAQEAFTFAGAEGRRGNRTKQSTNLTGIGGGCDQEYVKVGTQPWQQDLLKQVQWGPGGGGTTCNVTKPAQGLYYWAWDKDGRRTVLWDVSGTYSVQTGYNQGTLGAGLDSVVQVATLGGGSYTGGAYSYFYDAFGRRRAKMYPWSHKDEYFYDINNQLLTDRGLNNVGSSPTEFPETEYIWLGGRPIIGIQSRFNSGGIRENDNQGICNRLGVLTFCQLRYIITDYLGKPVLALDNSANARMSGSATYSAFGYANRRPAFVGSKHYVSSSDSVANFSEPIPATGFDVRMRLLLSRAHGVNHPTQGFAYYYWAGSQYSLGNGAHKWTPWAYSGNGQFNLTYSGNTSSYGFDVEAYEYETKEYGVHWWFPKLRLPGQYVDEETDLHENWNRYYDPGSGRYLSPEPLLQNPRFTAVMARRGMSTPAYAYAANNPINFFDPTGLTAISYNVTTRTLTIDPEIAGRSSYTMSATSGLGPNMNVTTPTAEMSEGGPIPQGYYEILVRELSNPNAAVTVGRAATQGDWGSFRVRLHEAQTSPANLLFGTTGRRSNFFLHGGRKPGSNGCVDVGGGLFGNSDTERLLSDIRADPDGVVPFSVHW